MTNARSIGLNDVAVKLGLKFEAEDWAFGGLFNQIDIPLFTRSGNVGTISNILSGRPNGIETKFFDFSATTAGQYWPIKQTMAAFSPEHPLPQFEAAPMDITHRIASTFTKWAVHVGPPGSPQTLWLSGPDEQSIRAIFNANLVEFLSALDQDAPWHFEGCAKALVLYRIGYLASAEQYPDFIDATASIAKTFLGFCGLDVGS